MSVFVERKAGIVAGVYANPQPGYAEEAIDDEHPDIVAFRTPPALPPNPFERLMDALDAEGAIPPGKAAAIKARLKA